MLIILSKSPQSRKLDSLLEIASSTAKNGQRAAILHIQDACVGVTMNEYCERLAKNKIDMYALKADCEARGLVEKTGGSVRLIDFRQWVKLVMSEHESVVSWTS